MATNEIDQEDGSDGFSMTSPLPSKKRKASSDEIEVDVNAPEPPSKKALRRLKKGKPLPPSKSGADSSPEPESKKKTSEEKRSEHGVWIGNLPWTASKSDIKGFIVKNSEITDDLITRVHMPTQDSKRNPNAEIPNANKSTQNKGFAYVDFSTPEAVKQAVDLSELLVSGRRVLIKDNKSFEGRPQKPRDEIKAGGKSPNKRVFLGNLSYDATEESLKEHFDKCGSIESIKVATFEDSGKCKGYAWIVFEQLDGAKNAVRGFVHIEDNDDDDDDDDDQANAEEVATESSPDVSNNTTTKKNKMRKWWVNRMKGRPLRMEFAEDAQVRYKKRYGKDAQRKADHSNDDKVEEIKENLAPLKKAEYRKPYAPRLTGGIVESAGTKTTF